MPISTTTAFKYVRYLAPANSYNNIAELEFDGTLTGQQPTRYSSIRQLPAAALRTMQST